MAHSERIEIKVTYHVGKSNRNSKTFQLHSMFQFHINALSQPTVRQHPLNHNPRRRVHRSIAKHCMHFLIEDGVSSDL
ncbi:hypothetical protein T08_11834 [Trichinella sp. T8]|nr:hypothetical protein T08_11834 [Trichinella sp. T8]